MGLHFIIFSIRNVILNDGFSHQIPTRSYVPSSFHLFSAPGEDLHLQCYTIGWVHLYRGTNSDELAEQCSIAYIFWYSMDRKRVYKYNTFTTLFHSSWGGVLFHHGCVFGCTSFSRRQLTDWPFCRRFKVVFIETTFSQSSAAKLATWERTSG